MNVVPKNPADQKDIDQLVAYWDKKEPIEWVQVTLMAGLRPVQAPPAHGCRA